MAITKEMDATKTVISTISGNKGLEPFTISNGTKKHNNNDEEGNNEKKMGFTVKQKIALVLLAAVDFISFCSMSIMAPFFPKEAALKGMSESLAGFVFSFYAVIMFLFSPIFGKLLPNIGVKPMFIVGVLTSGICNIIFGTLEYVEDFTTFTCLSFAVRGMEALGASAYSTAGYVIIINIFPKHAGTVRGILETFVGLGLSVGPAIGGLLFTVGGFGLPFYVVGLFTIALAPFNCYLLQSSEEHYVDKKKGSLRTLLKRPSILVTCMVIVVVSTSWSFLDPTLEPHLRKFNLTPGNIGLIFLLLSAMYGISSPLWGWFTDHSHNYWYLMCAGLFFSGVSLLFLGPSPLFPFFQDSLWVNIIALTTFGLFAAMGLIPTFQGIIDGAIEGGLEDNLSMQGIVAGLWSCVYSLGEVIGPAMGGALLEHVGFPITATIMSAINFIAAIIATLYYVTRKRSSTIDLMKTSSKTLEENGDYGFTNHITIERTD